MQQPTLSQQTHCRVFGNCARGSDPKWVWNATDRKCAPEVLLAGVSTKRVAEWPGHLNRKETQETHCNSLNNFLLQGFDKHIHWFRCSGKGEHLNLETMLNPTLNQLTTNALQDFQQPCPRFRSQAGMECHRPQMCPRDASGRGIHQTRSRVARASEPERNTRNPPQHIEKLYIAGFQQESPLVQMRRKREASEPYIIAEKAECGKQRAVKYRIYEEAGTSPSIRACSVCPCPTTASDSTHA